MTRTDENCLQAVLEKHIEAAVDEIINESLMGFDWPSDYKARLAALCVHALALASESVEAFQENSDE